MWWASGHHGSVIFSPKTILLLVKNRFIEATQTMIPALVGLSGGGAGVKATLVFTVAVLSHSFFAYLYNDAADFRDDLINGRKTITGGATERNFVDLAFIFLALGTFLDLFLPFKVAVLLLFIDTLVLLYSHPRFRLKVHPPMGQVIHLFVGMAFFMAGIFISKQEWILPNIFLLLYFGVLVLAGNLSNEVFGYQEDQNAGVKTLTSRWGVKMSLGVSLALHFFALSLFLVAYPSPYLGALISILFIIFLTLIARWYGEKKLSSCFLARYRFGYRVLFALTTTCIALLRLGLL